MHEAKMLIFAPHSIINPKLFPYVQLHIIMLHPADSYYQIKLSKILNLAWYSFLTENFFSGFLLDQLLL